MTIWNAIGIVLAAGWAWWTFSMAWTLLTKDYPVVDHYWQAVKSEPRMLLCGGCMMFLPCALVVSAIFT